MGHADAARAALQEERRARRTYWRLMLTGLLSVGKLLITSPGDVRRFRTPRASESRYARPPRRYELPPWEPSMQPSAERSRYLRPTRLCDHRAPEVVALAHALGARRRSDRVFADAAFAFAKEQLTLEIAPIDDVAKTLRRGTGTCFQLISVFIALCRAAGIPARYKIFATDMVQTWRDAVIDVDPLMKKWYDSLGYFLLEGEGEAQLNGEWVVAHVGPTAERQAAAGIPITRLGEDALGVWFHARPGTIMRPESMPPGLALGSRVLHAISPGSMERINISIQQQIARGRDVIAAAGGVAPYDAQARQALSAPP